jgi:hypothetical protein
MAEEKPEELILPLEWHLPDDLVSRYATNLVVQHTDQEFIISFFEATPPITLGQPEEVKARLEEQGYVRATCVARVIVSVGRMAEFINVLEDNLKRYLSKSEDQELE